MSAPPALPVLAGEAGEVGIGPAAAGEGIEEERVVLGAIDTGGLHEGGEAPIGIGAEADVVARLHDVAAVIDVGGPFIDGGAAVTLCPFDDEGGEDIEADHAFAFADFADGCVGEVALARSITGGIDQFAAVGM